MKAVGRVGDFAFYECTSLQRIELPSLITSIGNCAFSGCSNLQNITSYAEVPPTTYESFSLENYTNTILYVPTASLETYKASEYDWSNFTNIEPIGEENAIYTPEAASTLPSPTAIYTLDGTRISGEVGNLMRGTYIIKERGTIRKVVVK